MKKQTTPKIKAHFLRATFYLLLFVGVVLIVALSSAINLPSRPPKFPAPQNGTAFGVKAHESDASMAASATRGDRTLTVADRVAYQRAIEEVYWRHRIWPAANAGPKPSLGEVMSQAEIEDKVEGYLRDSQALADYWQRPITPDQLQAEMERMASHTKQPGVLREIFAALGNDPFVIAECLARPVLAERLLTELYAHDSRFHGELKRRAEAELRTHPSIRQMKQTLPAAASRGDAGAASGMYTEIEWVKSDSAETDSAPTDTKSVQAVKMNGSEWQESVEKLAGEFGHEDSVAAGVSPAQPRKLSGLPLQKLLAQIKTGVLSRLQEDDGHYYAVAVMNKGKDRLKLATVAWLKEPLQSWLAKAEAQAPVTMAAVSANYTLPVIGGQSGNSSPSSCSWSAGPNMPSPNVRSVGVFFPANGKFYAMGGRSSDIPGSDFIHPFEYDSSNGWTTDLAATYPDNQVSDMACGVLNDGGADYIYCVGGSAAGGNTATDRVFRYNPIAHTLTIVASPWPGAMGSILPGGFSVFNNKLYILGGFNINTGTVDTIYEFTPSPFPGSWVQRPAHLPVALGFIPTATIGNRIYMAGGSTWNGTTLQDSSVSIFYDLTTDTIGPIATIPRATAETRGLNFHDTMYVMGGGRDVPNPSNEVDVYDPVVNIWSTVCPFVIARRNFPTDTDGTSRIWLAGGYAPTTPTGSMEIFNCPGGPCAPSPTPTPTATPAATATPTATQPPPTPTSTPTATATFTPTPTATATATATFTPTPTPTPTCTDTWTATSTANAPTARVGHTAVWTGSEMIVWGGLNGNSSFNTGGRYVPSTDSWTTTSLTGAPAARSTHTAVWTGSRMIVWGGNGGGYLNTGGRYNPGTDTWTATSTANAPTARYAHTAVWTGSRMIVWGGFDGISSLNTGGRYNPSTDSWTATNTTGAPAGRFGHTAVWTGSRMIVWGGQDGNSYFNTGGRYVPSTDSWTTTSLTGAPAARQVHTAVWTGSRMIVWGGFDGSSYFNTGGRYDPSTDSWTTTSLTGVPAARLFHTAVWTGCQMIVWGGQGGSGGNLNTGGRYVPSTDTWTATSTANAPTGRTLHTAVWTGNRMIVWGGLDASGFLNTGGRYHVCCPAKP